MNETVESLAVRTLGPGELEAMCDLARYRLLRPEDESALHQELEPEGARARFRRLEARGLVTRHEAPSPGRIVYYALSQPGAELLGFSFKKPPTAHRAIFERLAVAEFCSTTGVTLLLPEELEDELRRREEDGQVLRVPGLHKNRFLLEPDGRFSFLCVEVGAPDRNLFSFLASVRRKASALAQRSEAWRALIEKGGFSFTILCAHHRRPAQLQRVARRMRPCLKVPLVVVTSGLLLMTRGVKK